MFETQKAPLHTPLQWAVRLIAGAACCLGLLWLFFSVRQTVAPTSITFPAYSEGQTETNAAYYNITPFTLTLDLPKDWSTRLPDVSSRTFSTPNTPIELMENGKKVATIGYGIFTPVQDVPADEYYKVAYSDLRLGSIARWCDDYVSIATTPTMQSATCRYVLVTAAEGQSAAQGTESAYPAVVAYDRTRGVYVAMYFEPGILDNKTVAGIAQSITFSGGAPYSTPCASPSVADTFTAALAAVTNEPVYTAVTNDFDGDGAQENFVLVGTDMEALTAWFVSDRTVRQLTPDGAVSTAVYPISAYLLPDGKLCAVFESYGVSGSSSFIYFVRDGEAIPSVLSGKVMGFTPEENGDSTAFHSTYDSCYSIENGERAYAGHT